MTPVLAERVGAGDVFVLDGAMGTMLYARGVFVNVCYDELNLSQPDLIRDIHREYLRAGAQIVETNTFGANPVKLSSYGLDARTEEINRAAGVVAHDAASGRANVLGAIGPLGIRIEPLGPTSRDEAVELFARQADGLLDGGVDGFLLETFADLDELHAAFRAVRSRSDLPVFAQMTIMEDGTTSYGTDVETIAHTVADWGADVIGLNCSVGPAGMLDAIERMARCIDLPLSVQPNAGLPRTVGDRQIYLASPEYMARYARRLVDAGARFIGGCCGTTPDHIRRIRDELASIQPRSSHPAVIARHEITPPAGVEPVSLADRSRIGAKLAADTFVETIELVPPKGWQHDLLVERCQALKDADVDAVAILDSSKARPRMGVLPSALIVERDVEIETIVHYTCRDRNVHGMMSELLGAAAAGIRNLLLVTGDAPTLGPYPDTSAVFDIDSIGLTNVVCRLNHGLDQGGNPIGDPTRYVIGVGVDPAAVDIELELKRFYWKVDAGAEYAVTQPVFDLGGFETFLERAQAFRIPVIATLWPLVSARNAEYLANEVPTVTIPEAVLDRMRRAQERGDDAALAEGVRIAREMRAALRDCAAGVQVSAPHGRVDVALDVLDRGARP